MGLLNWLFNRPRRPQGLRIDSSHFWSVTCDRRIDEPTVYRNLGLLLPEGSNVCLEVISPPKEVHNYFESRAASETVYIQPGTIWPKPTAYHLSATREVLTELAELAERHHHIEMGHHVHVYKGDRMLMSWFDFPDPSCLMISADLDPQAVTDFCAAINCSPIEEQNS